MYVSFAFPLPQNLFEGKSIKSQVKRITNRGEANVGREILTIKEDGVEEKFLTADLIEKATPVVIKNDLCFGNLCFTKEKGTINKKFLLRHHNDADNGNMGCQVSKGGTHIKLDTVWSVIDRLSENIRKLAMAGFQIFFY